MQKVWKVVAKLDDDERRSAIVGYPRFGVFNLIYGENIVTHPPERHPNAWPYAFISLELAKASIDSYCDISMQGKEIWEAEAEETMPCNMISRHMHDEHSLLSYWEEKSGYIMPPPRGTIKCSSIKLTKLVWPRV